MAGLTSQEKNALQFFKELVSEKFSRRVDAILLFGSKARKDDRPESDIDILVILRNKSWQDERLIYSMVTKTFMKTGVYISPKVYDKQVIAQKRQRNNAFLQEVDKDAMPI